MSVGRGSIGLVLTYDVEQRRTRLMRRQLRAPGAETATVLDAAGRVVALHATDSASVYLSVLARCPMASLSDVSAALYDARSMVKMLGMRRTMFVVPTDFAPIVQAAAGDEIAQRLRRRLLKELQTVPTEPQLAGDIDAWLTEVEASAERVLIEGGEALANTVANAEPRLRTALLPTTGKKWDTKQNITSRVLTLLGAQGRLVRGRPAGTWQSRQHRWAAARDLWADGMPTVPEDDARRSLVRRWLEVFGPATVADLQWWTGWSLGATRKALAGLDTVDVALDGAPGIVLADDVEPDAPVDPFAVLLPALDPTPMGWKERDWFLGPHRQELFDRNGNIGPTIWWDGRIVGGWGMRDGGVVWQLLDDVGTEAEEAVEQAASDLHARLESTTVVPTFRTPLERRLTT